MTADRVNILLVDDQPSKLLTYEAILQGLGENLLKASSAREALDCLLRNDIAVVLADVCMPDLDGYELATMIRQHPRFQKTAIIFVSAVLMTDLDRLRGYESGGVDYVPVPIVPEILRAKVSVFAELYRKTRQLEALNKALEDRVAERTAALETTTRALRESNRRKDEFLAMLAHELRNPLAPIRTAVHLLRNPRLPEPHREKAGTIIERQVDHLVRLVDDLLDVSRISRGIIALDRAVVDMTDVLTGALEANRPLIDNGGLTVTVDLPASPLPVYGDSMRLVQAVGNVLHNAVKFTPRGGRVHVSARQHGGDAVVRVKDTGIGIRPDMLEKVFDLFVQLEPGRGHGGLGLGLSLVRRLVEMHGGRVEAASAGSDRGTEITLRLPLSEQHVVAPNPATTAPHELAPSGPRRVLVVDDNRDAADTMALMLESAGHKTRRAYDGLEALQTGESFNPEMVLLDLGMPNLDGYEAVRRIRAQRWGRHALVVALTGWGQEEDRQRTAQAGFDLHLVKPVGEAELADALSRLNGREPVLSDGDL